MSSLPSVGSNPVPQQTEATATKSKRKKRKPPSVETKIQTLPLDRIFFNFQPMGSKELFKVPISILDDQIQNYYKQNADEKSVEPPAHGERLARWKSTYPNVRIYEVKSIQPATFYGTMSGMKFLKDYGAIFKAALHQALESSDEIKKARRSNAPESLIEKSGPEVPPLLFLPLAQLTSSLFLEKTTTEIPF